jgi:hypothetical protein
VQPHGPRHAPERDVPNELELVGDLRAVSAEPGELRAVSAEPGERIVEIVDSEQ